MRNKLDVTILTRQGVKIWLICKKKRTTACVEKYL